MTVRGSGGSARGGRGRRRTATSAESARASASGRRPEQVRRPRRESAAAEPEEPPRRRPARPARRKRRRAGLLGFAPTRRAGVLAIVVAALALSIAVPLRTYLSQRDDVKVQEQHQAELRTQVQQLEQRKAQLSDPAQVEAEARRRLRYVKPGETPYVVQLPGGAAAPQNSQHLKAQPPEGAWYQSLWDSVSGG